MWTAHIWDQMMGKIKSINFWIFYFTKKIKSVNSSPKQKKRDEYKSALDSENLQTIREQNYEVPVQKEKEKKFVVDKDNSAKFIFI